MDKYLLTGLICSATVLTIATIPVLIKKYRMQARSDGPRNMAASNQAHPGFFIMAGDSGSSCSDGGGGGCDGGGGGGGGE